MNRLYTIASRFWCVSAMAILAVLWLVPMQGQAQTFTIGANNGSNGTTAQPTPFANFFEGSRGQYMYRAAELTAAGMVPGMLITEVAFTVVNPNTSTAYNNYKVWIGQTTNADLAAYVPAAQLTLVNGPSTVDATAGVKNFPFTAPFVWNGTSNIVVQVFHNNNTSAAVTDWNQNMSVIWTTGLPANSSRSNWADNTDEPTILNDAAFPTGTNTFRPQAIFTAIPPTPCSGTITGGTTAASPTSFCTSGSTSLTVTGGTGLALGLTYQWQSSPDGVTWTDIVGANSSSFATGTITTTTHFRRQITCTNNASSDFSTPVIFANVLGSPVYATLPYIQDFEAWQDKCSTKEIPVEAATYPPGSKFWVNTPSTGNLSWRKQNEGANAGWTNVANGAITPISGTGAARFHSAAATATNASGSGQGWMDLHVNLGSTFKKELRFLYRNRQQFIWTNKVPNAPLEWVPINNDQLEVLLSTDGGQTFPTTLGVFGNDTPDDIPVITSPIPPNGTVTTDKPTNWKKIVIKIGQITPQAIIRFRATTGTAVPPLLSYTPTDIGLDDVQVVELKPCTGTPIPGTLTATPAKLCDPGTSYLSVTGSEDLLGGQDMDFVWETSTDGVNWSVVTGAILPDYTTPVLTTEQPYYRRKIICRNGGLFAYTNVVQIQQVRPTYAVVTPGVAGAYYQNFNSWLDGCQLKQIPDANWKNTPNIGSRSWRNRLDILPTSTPPNVGNWLLNNVAPTTNIAHNAAIEAGVTATTNGVAEFFSRGAVGVGELDLYANLSASDNRKAVQFWYNNTSGTDQMSVLLSTNGNAAAPIPIATQLGAFTQPTNPAQNGGWEKKGFYIAAPFNQSATTVIRFRASSGGPPNEASDIGIDSLFLIDLVPCSTTPIPGTAAASPANFCAGTEVTISVTKGSDDASVARDDKHTFQWQRCITGNCGANSPDWTDIPAAENGTQASYRFVAVAQPNQIPPGSGTIVPTQYRRKIICPNGNLFAFSNAVTLEFPYMMAYAPIPYYQGFETAWVNGGATGDRATNTVSAQNPAPDNNRYWRNTPCTGAASWRRMLNATVVSATGWTTTGNWTVNGRVVPIGTGAAAFNTFGARDSNEGKLDLYVDASGTQMKQLRFRYRNPNRNTPFDAYNDDALEVKISFDNGIEDDFQDILTLGSTGGMPPIPATLPSATTPQGWIPYYYNFNNDAPKTVIRFNGKRIFSVDENNVAQGTDIGLDEVFVVYVNDCAAAGTLVGGTAEKSAEFCQRPPFVLYVLGSSSDTHYGFEYQWQVSENGGAFQDIPGATEPNFFMDGSRVGTFRRIIKCTATGTTALSTEVSTVFAYPLTYATLPYSQNFDLSWINGCGTKDIPDQFWKSTPFTGSNSWRKNGEGNTANWIYNIPDASPEPAAGPGCAVFHSFFVISPFPGTPTAGPPTGSLDLYVNASTPGTKLLRFWYINPDDLTPVADPANGNKDKLEIFISDNGGETFTKLTELGRQDNWAEFQFPFTSNSGATVIRFQGNGVVDDTDIGLDEVNVSVLAPCAAGLVGGNAKPSTDLGNACTALQVLYFVEGSSTNNQEGFTYQWQASLDAGVTWVNINGATNANYEASPLTTTRYRRILRCTATGSEAISGYHEFTISQAPEFATLPFTEDFERWADACDTKDVPVPATNKYYWRTRPFLGNNAWRNANDSDLAFSGWADRTFTSWQQGGRTIPALGTGAASFHSFSAGNRTTGDMELYLNAQASPTEVKVLEFDYSNPDYPSNVAGFTNDDKLDVYLSTDGGFSFGTLPILSLTRTKDLWETKRVVFDNVSQPFLTAQYVVVRFRATADNGGTDIGLDNVSMRVLPKKDAGVTAIEFNRCSPIYGKVVVEVTNFGSETIQNFPVKFSIDGGANYVTENFPTPIEIFKKAKYEFFVPTNILGINTLNITAATALAGDANAANDSKTVTLNVTNFAGVPYTEDFNTGIPANWRVVGKLNTPSWFGAVKNDNVAPLNANEFPANLLQFSLLGNGLNGGFVALDDNKGGAARTFDADRVITPRFDLSNYTNAQIKFNGYSSNVIANGAGKFTLEIKVDDGDDTRNWTPMQVQAGVPGVPDDFNQGVLGAQPYTVVIPPAFQGKKDVIIAFRYNDDGVITGGAAFDDFQLLATAIDIPLAKITTVPVDRAYVNRGTNGHIVYQFKVEANAGNAVISDVVLKTGNQEYKTTDFKTNSFRLWQSDKSTFDPSAFVIATSSVVAKGEKVVFPCLNYAVAKNTTKHFYFTVDVADAPTATLKDSINVQLPTIASDNTDNVITIFGNRVGIDLKEGGYQIIADPNNPPTAEDIVFTMKQKTANSDPDLVFKAEDFKFKDLDATTFGDIFRRLQITTKNLPNSEAKLQLNGVDVTNGQVISVTDIPKLKFIPRLNDAKVNYASFTFKVYDLRDWSVSDYNARIDVISDKIFMPTLFSPNGDGSNDVFVIHGGEGTIDKLTFKILDRNNNPMYESSDLKEITTTGWNGKKDGKDQPAGAYMWYIEGTYKDGKPIDFNGKKTGVIRLVR